MTLPPTFADLPLLTFERQADWGEWLASNHAASSGIWLALAKKGSGSTSVTYAEALEEALCYGWIDGQKQRHDERAWLQKFTPRGRKSIWSKVNRAKAEVLIESGQMRPAGLKAVEAAREDGRWEAAYDSATAATVPEDLQAALEASPTAKTFFATLKGSNRYAILFRLQTAKKAETRAKRLAQFIGMLERGEVIHV